MEGGIRERSVIEPRAQVDGVQADALGGAGRDNGQGAEQTSFLACSDAEDFDIAVRRHAKMGGRAAVAQPAVARTRSSADAGALRRLRPPSLGAAAARARTAVGPCSHSPR